MQERLRNPEVRLRIDDGDFRFVLKGAEARPREDGSWELRETLPDGSVAVSVIKDGEDMWSGVLRPGDPDAN